MKCTKCSTVITPVVAIDIDGTMGLYHEHFLGFAEQYLGFEVLWDYKGGQPFRQWFKKQFTTTDDVWHDVKLAYRQGGMKRSMPVYPGAYELCKNIRTLGGAELWVTTTRPYIRHDNIDPDTREWLRRNNILYDYLLYDGQKYQKLGDLVGSRVVAVLDDLAEELEEASSVFGSDVAILRMNSFNEYSRPYHQQVRSLHQAEVLILDKLRIWKEQHEDGRI
jgi:hypothetical protein